MADTDRRALGGPGVVLVVVYAVLALAATGRSVLQITTEFADAPLAYTLSALAAVVYILATWCLARGGRWVTVGRWACTFELVGVLVVGAASYLVPEAFPAKTVWSHFGQGYGFVPLVLPVLGLLWFRKVDRDAAAAELGPPDAGEPGSAPAPDAPMG
jgi:hypothetical protein